MQDEEELLVTSLKRNNKIRRAVERKLRGALRKITEHNDQLFVELCETENAKAAELALEKLWTLGGFSCGPRDYEQIVERCLECLGKTKPID
jgi:hypothetical protein